jgi:DnaK suppressor protein
LQLDNKLSAECPGIVEMMLPGNNIYREILELKEVLMSRSEEMENICERLIKKRDQVFEAHRLSEEARIILSEHDIESEETAQKETIADVLATLDEKEQKDIQAINRALARMEFGEFGSCEVCGEEIAVERLEAIPWTSVCSKHARTE